MAHPVLSLFPQHFLFAVIFADTSEALTLARSILEGGGEFNDSSIEHATRDEALAFVKDCLPTAMDIICGSCWAGKYQGEWSTKNYDNNESSLLDSVTLPDVLPDSI